VTARQVQLVVAKAFRPMHDAVFLNVQSGGCGHEADIFIVRRSLWGIEVEVKVSVHDFKADFRKGTDDRWGPAWGKHERLTAGHPRYISRLEQPDHHLFNGVDENTWYVYDTEDREPHRCRHFYFAVPQDIRAKVEPLVPDHAGLIVVDGARATVVKAAPKLAKARKVTEAELSRLYRSCYMKHWQTLFAEARRAI